MGIVTKTGDDGKSRWLGRIEDKDGVLLEAIGAIDELSAILQLVSRKSKVESRKIRVIVDDLWGIMGEITYGKIYPLRGLCNLKFKISKFEEEIEKIEMELPKLDKFITFKTKKGQELNWARTVARRAERKVVALGNHKEILRYFNRLSDYLFILARKEE